MAHSIYGPPSHSLEVIRVRIEVPTESNGWVTSAHGTGESSTKRSPLWSDAESWVNTEQVCGLSVSDWTAHLVLTAIQEAPGNQRALDRALRGAYLDMDPMF